MTRRHVLVALGPPETEVAEGRAHPGGRARSVGLPEGSERTRVTGADRDAARSSSRRCHECDRSVGGRAAWCGSCGARLAEGRVPSDAPTRDGRSDRHRQARTGPTTGQAVEQRPPASTADTDPAALAHDHDHDQSTQPTSGADRPAFRAAAGVLLIVTALALVLVVAGDQATPQGTAGRVDLPNGLIADAPLPTDRLTLAWAWRPDEQDVVTGSFPPQVTVVDADDGLVAIDGLLLDSRAERVVGRLPWNAVAVGDRVVVADDAGVATWDPRAGEARDEIPLDGVGDLDNARVVGGLDGDRLVVETYPRTAATDGRRSPRGLVLAPDGSTTPIADQVGRELVATLGGRFVLTIADESDGDGVFAVVDPDDGRLIGELGSLRDGTSVVELDGTVVRGEGETLHTLLPDGRTQQRQVAGLDDIAPLGVVGDRLVVGGRSASGDGHLVAHLPRPPWDGRDDVEVLARLPDAARPREVDPYTRGHTGIWRPGDAAVVGDLIVLHDTDGGVVRALDLAGRTVWSAPVEDGVTITGVGDEVVLATPRNAGTPWEDGRLLEVLAAADGTPRWSTTTAPPTRLGRTGFVVSADGTQIAPASGDPARVTLDARFGTVVDVGPERPVATVTIDGEVVEVQTEPTSATTLHAVVGDRTVEVATFEGSHAELIGIAGSSMLVTHYPHEYEDGERPMFRLELVPLDGDPAGITTVTDDQERLLVQTPDVPSSGIGRMTSIAAVQGDDGLQVLDPATGEPRFAIDGAFAVIPVADDRLVALDRRGWWLVDGADGTPIGEPREVPFDGVTAGDGMVASVRYDGVVEVVDADDGGMVWRTADEPVMPSAMAFAGDHLLVATRDGRLRQHDPEGRVVAELDFDGAIATAVAWANGTLVVEVDGEIRGYRTDGRGVPELGEVEVP